MWYLPFTAWLISLSLMLSSSIHAVMKGRSSFFLLHSIPFCKCTVVFWSTYLWNFLRKLKMELPFDPAIPLLGLYPNNPETPVQNNLCTPMFIAAQFTIAKCWKQPKCPSVNECLSCFHLNLNILDCGYFQNFLLQSPSIMDNIINYIGKMQFMKCTQ